MRFLVTLVCLCCTLRSVASVEYSVDCMQFYESLTTYVDCNGQCPAMQNARDCSVNALVHRMLMYEDMIAVRNTSVVYDFKDPAQLSRLLVFASIGRHFAKQSGVKTPYFTWDGTAGTLVLNQMSCEFQRPLYGFILIVTLVFVVVFVAMHVTVVSSESKVYQKETTDSTAVGFRVTKTLQ
jgi:hypothetical protein